MSNRSQAKWAPFNAVAPGDEMVKDVLKRKYVVKMPILSDDQINEIEEKVLISYNNQTKIKVKYFRSGRYYLREGIVSNIDALGRKIALNGNYSLFFSQIIEIN